MKNVLFCGALAFASAAHAEFYADCTVNGGSEGILRRAPKNFALNESGEITLRVTKARKTQNFSTRSKNLLALPRRGGYVSFKSLTPQGGLTLGEIYSLDLGACDSTGESGATYTWRIEEADHVQRNGIATYSCQCGVD